MCKSQFELVSPNEILNMQMTAIYYYLLKFEFAFVYTSKFINCPLRASDIATIQIEIEIEQWIYLFSFL